MKRKLIGFNEKDYESGEKGASYKMNKRQLVDSMSAKSGMTTKQSERALVWYKKVDNLFYTTPNLIWCTDFTYIRLANGKMRYNCATIDLYDRSVVATANSDYINMELAKTTLEYTV